MRKRCISVLVVVVLLSLVSSLRAGEVIDRIVAIVNGSVIVQSQLEDDLCFEAFSDGRPITNISDDERRAALGHLVDQELLRQQMGSEIHQPTAEQVQRRIEEIRANHPDAKTESGWQQTLSKYGLTEKQLETRVTQQLALLREADIRLRPSVQIENRGIEDYYSNVFLPKLRQSGGADVPLPEVASQIREILTQQKIDEMFDSWLRSLRKDSKVRTLLPAEATKYAGGASK
jgi:parvulin-like peptidyl-prolyl isomerase